MGARTVFQLRGWTFEAVHSRKASGDAECAALSQLLALQPGEALPHELRLADGLLIRSGDFGLTVNTALFIARATLVPVAASHCTDYTHSFCGCRSLATDLPPHLAKVAHTARNATSKLEALNFSLCYGCFSRDGAGGAQAKTYTQLVAALRAQFGEESLYARLQELPEAPRFVLRNEVFVLPEEQLLDQTLAIRFAYSSVLSADDLDDIGESLWTAKLRVTDAYWYALLRSETRIDNYKQFVCETRLFHQFGSGDLLRQVDLATFPHIVKNGAFLLAPVNKVVFQDIITIT